MYNHIMCVRRLEIFTKPQYPNSYEEISLQMYTSIEGSVETFWQFMRV